MFGIKCSGAERWLVEVGVAGLGSQVHVCVGLFRNVTSDD